MFGGRSFLGAEQVYISDVGWRRRQVRLLRLARPITVADGVVVIAG